MLPIWVLQLLNPSTTKVINLWCLPHVKCAVSNHWLSFSYPGLPKMQHELSTTLHWALLNKCYYLILFSLWEVVELFPEKCLQFFRELLLHWVEVEVVCRTPALNAGWKCWRLVCSASSTFTEYSSVITPVITLEIGFHQYLFCTYILAVSNTRIPAKKMMKGTQFLYYPFL